MKTFKTKLGTELPLLDLKGKDYLQVRHRVQWFREEMPLGRIETMMKINEKDYCLFEATIYDKDGRNLANAHGREDYKHFADAMEKAESKAIGRALGFCGYGTQFAQELEEGERIVDSPSPRINVAYELKPTYKLPPKVEDVSKQNEYVPIPEIASNYVWPWGPKKGKKLSEFTRNELESAYKWVSGIDKPQKSHRAALDCLELVLDKRAPTTNSMPEMPAHMNDQLPF